MDPVHIEKSGENAQEQVDNCLHRLRQMMLDTANTFTFDMQGTGTGTVVSTLVVGPLVVGPKNPPKPQSDFKAEAVVNGPSAPEPTEEPPAAEVVAVSEAAQASTDVPLADLPEFTVPVEEAKATGKNVAAEPSDPEPEAAAE
jgi:hypothetical protein